MPTYAYQCTVCEHDFEVFQKITDPPITECPQCKGEVRKIYFPVGIVFKGPGFHVTDYRTPEKKDDGDGPKDRAPEAKEPEKEKETSEAHSS